MHNALFLFACATFLGIRLKTKQLSYLAIGLPEIYPTLDYCFPVFALAAVFGVSSLFTSYLFFWRLAPSVRSRFQLLDTLSYGILTLPISSSLLAFSVVKLALCAFSWVRYRPREWRQTLGALVVMIAAHVLFHGMVSPLKWSQPIAAVQLYENNTMGSTTPLYQANYVNAKTYAFSSFHPTYWGGIAHGPMQAYSYAMGFLTLLLDLPSIDVASFYRAELILLFLWTVASSFGFYLFLREGLKLSYLVSTLGGVLYLYGNPYAIEAFRYNANCNIGIFLSLPYALLLIKLGAEKITLRLLFAGGVVLSTPLYIITPHPDACIFGLGFLCFYSFALFWKKEKAKIKACLAPLTVITGFSGGALLYALPLLAMLSRHEASIFGHRDGVFLHDIYRGAHEIFYLFRVSILGIGLVFTLRQWMINRRSERIEIPAFFLFIAVFSLCIFPGKSGPFASAVAALFPSLNFQMLFRVQIYLGLAMLICLLCAWDAHIVQFHRRFFDHLLLFWGAAFAVSYGYRILVPGVLMGLTAFSVIVLWKRLPNWALQRLSAAAMVLIAVGACFFEKSNLDSHQLHDPYITLQALVSNYESLAVKDKASLRLLQARLTAFENEIPSQSLEGQRFHSALEELGVRSAANLNPQQVIAIAKANGPLIDNFNVRLNPPPASIRRREILFNDAALFEDIESPFQRILMATKLEDNHIGAWVSGFFIHNSDQMVDTRFCAAYPPLNAIYLSPDDYFQKVGRALEGRSWAISSAQALSSTTRKLFNIAGIDLYTLDAESYYSPLVDRTDLTPLSNKLPESLRHSLIAVKDARSYGMVYLASSIHPIAPDENRVSGILPPFEGKNAAIFPYYRRSVDSMRNQLEHLSEKYSVLLEGSVAPSRELADFKPNAFHIKNLIANKAAIDVECNSAPCLLVLNYAMLSGWRAFSDRTRLKIQRVNYAFMGVEIPQGKHLVWFELRDRPGELALFLTLLCYGTAIVLVGSPLTLPESIGGAGKYRRKIR